MPYFDEPVVLLYNCTNTANRFSTVQIRQTDFLLYKYGKQVFYCTNTANRFSTVQIQQTGFSTAQIQQTGFLLYKYSKQVFYCTNIAVYLYFYLDGIHCI